jgi:L-ascorbate metabolism protein UlaG (beta-lactamase superfamily)
MKITKFVHSCLLVETDDRTALFDPGMMSTKSIDVSKITKLDDIIITHEHFDHFAIDIVKEIVQKFPDVRITSTQSVVDKLIKENITAENKPSDGVVFFDAPHEKTYPLIETPTEIGVHYLDVLTDPGDSHSFSETKAILALPVQAPWGTSVNAVNLAIKLKPRYVLPIHDWHWRDEARKAMYDTFSNIFKQHGIEFFSLENGVPIEIGSP